MSQSEVSGSSLIDQLPLIAGLPEAVRDVVADSFVPIRFEFGETVFVAGEEGDAYYVVVEGQARVLIDEGGGAEVSLNLLGPRDAFGEDALLDGTPRTMTVRAASPLTVLRLDAGLFAAVVSRYPEIRASFETAARARRLNEFLRLHSAFSVLRASSGVDLLEHLEEMTLGDGQTAVRQGDDADAMFLIQEGRLGVWREADGESRRIRTLHAGEFFGEFALVLDSARTATVTAEGEVKLLRLGREGFERLMRSSPRFAARIHERIALYEARERKPAVEPAPEPGDVWAAEDPGLAVAEDGAEDVSPAPPPRRRRRFPFVRQIDQMDCGAACIAMVCKSFGHDVSITAIREAVGTGTEGTTRRGLTSGGDELGLKMRSIKSSPERLDVLPLPAIIHWQGNHWIVVHGVDGDRVLVADPARGLRKFDRSEVAEHWSGYAALAEPTERLADAPRGGLDLRWLWPFVRPHSRRLTIALLLALVAAGLEMTLPVFAQVIIDNVVKHRNQSLLYLITLAMLALLTLAVVITVIQRWMVAHVASRLDADSLDFISGRLLRLPMSYFELRRTGDIERRLSGMQQVRETVIQNGVAAATAVTQLLVAVLVMFIYSPILGAVYLACAPLYALLMRYSRLRILRERMALEFGELRDKLLRAPTSRRWSTRAWSRS